MHMHLVQFMINAAIDSRHNCYGSNAIFLGYDHLEQWFSNVFSCSPLTNPDALNSSPTKNAKKVIAKFSPGCGCKCLLKIIIKPLQNNNFRNNSLKKLQKIN